MNKKVVALALAVLVVFSLSVVALTPVVSAEPPGKIPLYEELCSDNHPWGGDSHPWGGDDHPWGG